MERIKWINFECIHFFFISEHCLQNGQHSDEGYDYLHGKRKTVMVLIILVIVLICLSIIVGLGFLIREICCAKRQQNQDGRYRLLPKSDEDDDADDEFFIPSINVKDSLKA